MISYSDLHAQGNKGVQLWRVIGRVNGRAIGRLCGLVCGLVRGLGGERFWMMALVRCWCGVGAVQARRVQR